MATKTTGKSIKSKKVSANLPERQKRLDDLQKRAQRIQNSVKAVYNEYI